MGFRFIWNSIFIFFLILRPFAFAIPHQIEKWLEFETQNNAAALRSQKPYALSYVLIPMEYVDIKGLDKVSKEIQDTLTVEKEGKKFYRWIFHPEDQKYYSNVLGFLSKRKISAEVVSNDLTGYATASRSFVIENSKNGAFFSYKQPTSHSAGLWKDKPQEVFDAQDVWKVSEFLERKNFENIIILPEPFIAAIAQLDQAAIVRDIKPLVQKDKLYLPAFSALHENLGAEIAKWHGSKNPGEFWKKNYAIPLGRALGEFFVKTGLYPDSPHLQNFLIEMTSTYEFTGRIVFRDLGDVYIHKQLLKVNGGTSLLEAWSDRSAVRLGVLHAGVGFTHGTPRPSWLSVVSENQWAEAFYNAFESQVKSRTGVAKLISSLGTTGSGVQTFHPSKNAVLTSKVPQRVPNSSYYSKDYSTHSNEWVRYFLALCAKQALDF